MFSGFLGPFFCSFALSGRVIFCTAFSSARPPFFFLFKSRHQNRERGQGTLFESFSAGDNGSVITIFASGKSVLYLLTPFRPCDFFPRPKNFPDYGDVTSLFFAPREMRRDRIFGSISRENSRDKPRRKKPRSEQHFQLSETIGAREETAWKRNK